ncbi:MAG: hypothetical protein KGI41_01745 [Patescibacteria group bacterium]|nr:hypothetical protein [Patescibacteria group bacterium]
MRSDYSRILAAIAETSDEKAAGEAVAKLIAHLKSAGRVKMLPQVLRELRTLAARRARTAPVVEVANGKDADAALRAAREAGIDAKEASVNPALVSGWRARREGVLVDRSGKQALIRIYTAAVSGS